MTNIIDQFRKLHIPGDPLILFNIWDAGTARVVAEAGAKAIATGSYGVAESLGYKDGESVPIDAALANLANIVRVTDVPVSIDMESGYGMSPVDVSASVARALAGGAAGINLEDRMPGQDALTSIETQAARIRAAADTGIFVNARCDGFRGIPADQHGPEIVERVMERARAYADAGADCLFVPFTTHRASIAAIVEASPIPVNIIWTPAEAGGFASARELAELGVARISHGHRPWAAAMNWIKQEARRALAGNAPNYDQE